MPPGRLIVSSDSPKMMEMHNASELEMPAIANIITVAPSLTPHPEIEIGIIDRKSAGGVRINICQKVIEILRASAIAK
jgi:hypothetical protein